MSQYLTLVVMALVMAAAQAEQQPGPGCADEQSVGSQGMTMPLFQEPSQLRVRRQLDQQQQPNPLGFLTDLGQQAAQIQNSAKMFSSLFSSGPTTPNQAAAASQLQQAFQPQQQSQQPSAAALTAQLSELIRSTQDRSMKMASDTTQNAAQVAQAGQQQAQQATGGFQSALKELGSGLQKIAMNNPSLLPDVKNLYSSVSSKLSTTSSQFAPQPASFPSSGPIVPAKNGDQLVDNLAKVAMGQTHRIQSELESHRHEFIYLQLVSQLLALFKQKVQLLTLVCSREFEDPSFDLLGGFLTYFH